MAFKRNGIVYRNLQEQVDYLSQRIKDATDVVKNVVSVSTELPPVADYEIGDTVAIGTEFPYSYWVKTTNGWVNLGVFPGVGPEGPEGPAGADGFIPAAIDEEAYDVDSVDNVSAKGLAWYQKIKETNAEGDTIDVLTKQTAPIVGLGLVNMHRSASGKRYEIELEPTIKSGEESCSLILSGVDCENYGCNSIVSGEDNSIQSGDNNFVTGQFNSVQTSNNLVCGIGNEVTESSEAIIAGSYCDDTAADNLLVLGNGSQGHPSNALEVTNDGIMTFNNDQLRINPAEDNALRHRLYWRMAGTPVNAPATATRAILPSISPYAKAIMIRFNTSGSGKRTTKFYNNGFAIASMPAAAAIYNNQATVIINIDKRDTQLIFTSEWFCEGVTFASTANSNARGFFTFPENTNIVETLTMEDPNQFGAAYNNITVYELI